MPLAELADAIVGTARATLEATIEFINAHPTWRARVVYGDTDSVFVHLPGRTRTQAFEVGAQMAEAVTARNPSPIKLKFEKVRRDFCMTSLTLRCACPACHPPLDIL
jgi:DNA polymerase zeta